MRTVLQSTQTECGLAALSTLMSHYGYETTIQEMRQLAAPGRSGLNLAQMREITKESGFETKLFGVSSSASIQDFPVPSVAFWDESHYVVIRKIHKDRVEVVDPAVGRVVLSLDEFAQSFSGVLLTIAPGENFTKRRTKQGGLLRFILNYLPDSTLWMFGLPMLAGIVSGIALLPPVTTQFVVDHLLPSGLSYSLLPLLLLFGGVTVFYLLMIVARTELTIWLEKSIDVSMMIRIYRHLLALPYSYFMNRSSGDLLVRFSSSSTIRDALSGRLFPLLMDMMVLLFYSLLLVSYHTYYLYSVVGLLFLFSVLVLVTLRMSKRFADKELQKMSESQSVLLETLEGVETVKSLALEPESRRRYETPYLESVRWSLRRERLENALHASFQGMSLFLPLSLLILGVYLYSIGELSVGQLLAAGTVAGTAIAPVMNIGIGLQSLQNVGVHTARLQDITQESPEPVGGDVEVDFKGKVEFKGVTIAYDGEPPVIENASFAIESGQSVAIVGPSGAGKSTLAKVILGLLPVQSGTVRYQGVDHEAVQLQSVRSRVGLVTQSVSGISGSIGENIAFGRDWLTRDDIRTACHYAGLLETVDALPMGLETPLGESGKGLSGGQLQRLAIARAVVTSPALLVLDEATSHLDVETERDVTARVDELRITKVVIAHRLSTIRSADFLIVVDGSKRVRTMSVDEYLHQHESAE